MTTVEIYAKKCLAEKHIPLVIEKCVTKFFNCPKTIVTCSSTKVEQMYKQGPIRGYMYVSTRELERQTKVGR